MLWLKNGNLLLNIGPKADGTIPEQDQTSPHRDRDWLAVNGEAIIEVGMAVSSGRTDRGPGRFLLQTGKRHSIPAKDSAIPCVKACFMLSSWNQVEGKKS